MDSSCALLVRIGHRFDRAVMDELLNRFETGKVPPFFVMKAIGDYAQQERTYTSVSMRTRAMMTCDCICHHHVQQCSL